MGAFKEALKDALDFTNEVIIPFACIFAFIGVIIWVCS